MTTKSSPAAAHRQPEYKKPSLKSRFFFKDNCEQPKIAKGLNIKHTLMATLVSVTMAGMALVVANAPVQAATSGIYIAPAAGNFAIGSTIRVEVRENSGSDMVNAVQADLIYSKQNLEFVNSDATGSAFGVDATPADKVVCPQAGACTIPRGSISAISGDKLITIVNFKVIAAGTGTIQVSASSLLLSSSTNTDITPNKTGANYVLTGGGTIPPTPNPAPTPTPTPSPNGPCAAAASDLGTDSITITVPADATYSIWTRMIVPDTSHNSINLQVDATNCYNVAGGTFAATAFADNTSNWVNYAGGTASGVMNLALSAGNHTFKYIGTKAGVGVDKILVTSNTACLPTGLGDNCPSAATTPPTINLLTPIANSAATGPVNFSATATAAKGNITSVKFLVDGQEVNTDTASPYSYSWNSASVANGSHVITAQATDADGNTAVTSPVTITVNNASSCTGNPSAPAGLTVTGTSANSVSLSWNASTPAKDCTIKGYNIYRNGNLVTSVTSGTTFQEAGLVPGGTLSYTVAAADTSNHVSGQSAAVTATTSTDAIAPSQPSNVHSTLVADERVALAWIPSTDNSSVAGYIIYRAQGAVTTGINTAVGTVADVSFSDSGLTPNTKYTYVVKAKDAAGNLSAASAPLTITTAATNPGVGSGIYLKPDSGNFVVGSNVTVEVRENSGSQMVNAVQADLAYSAANLQFVSADAAGSDFGIEASNPNTTAGNGTVSIPRGNTSALSGDKLISKVTFKVIETGTGTIEVSTSSVLLSSATNSDIAGQRLGAGYSLTTTPTPLPPTPPVVPPTPPTPPTNPQTPPPTTPLPASPPSTRPGSSPTSSTGPTKTVTTTPTTTARTPVISSTTIAPTGNTNPLPLTGGSQVELSDPAVVQTYGDTSAPIKKVEYLLNGKLVSTVSTPPYSYTVKTSNLRNGKYTLTTKTYYTSGKVDSSNSAITVNNPMNVTQIMLQLKHYAWVLMLLALAAGGVIWFMFFRGTDGDEFGDTDISGGYGVPGMYDDPNVAGAGPQIPSTMPPGSSPPVMDMEPPPSITPVPGQGPDPYGRY